MRRQRSLAPGSSTVLVHARQVVAAVAVLWGLGSPGRAEAAGGTAQILTAPDVTAVITAAAQAQHLAWGGSVCTASPALVADVRPVLACP